MPDTAVSRTKAKATAASKEGAAAAKRRRQLDYMDVACKQPESTSTSGRTSPSSWVWKCPDQDEVDSGPSKRNCAFFWSQMHEFERRLVTAAESRDQGVAATDSNNNSNRASAIYVDEDDVFSGFGDDPRSTASSLPPNMTSSWSTPRSREPTSWRSLMFSETTSLPYDDQAGQAAATSLPGTMARSTTSTATENPLIRWRSMPSVVNETPGRGRRKSEVLYFSYAESLMTGLDI